MPPATNLGLWMKRRRKALDLTQAELAVRMGYALSTIRKFEAGNLRPSSEAAERLVQVLGSERDPIPAFLHLARRPPASQSPAGVGEQSSRPLLPHAAVPLIGREEVAAAVTQQLVGGPARVITLSGPPGIGKTRLAIHLASAVHAMVPVGVSFIALETMTDPAQLLPVIAHSLGVTAQPGTSLVGAIQSAIGSRPFLLILDTLEHLRTAGTALAALSAACAGLKILVTSQTRLHIAGEQVIKLPPLALAPPLGTETQDADAVVLFAAFARLSQPHFVVTPGNRAAVAALCAHLDGIPLAIELVASRSKVLSPAALLSRIETLSLSVHNRRLDRPARHSTLRTAIDWTYHLLSEEEQYVFRRLGVVGGNITSDIAAALYPPQDEAATPIAALLAHLEESSLLSVQYDEVGGSRFTMLSLLRAYAMEQLTRCGERRSIEERYAAYCRARAAQASVHDRGPFAGSMRETRAHHDDHLREGSTGNE